jgi:thioredoxin 1
MIFLYIIGAFVLFVISMQLMVRWRGSRKRGTRVEGLGGELGKAVSSGKTVLAYFYSPSCGACRAQTPIIDAMRKQHRGVFKINVADDLPTARVLGVMATPTTVLIKDGIVEEFMVGPRNESQLRASLGA